MREVVLDTETTGFDPESGDRIVEIGAVELTGHIATGNTYHQYINPERAVPNDAFQVHGLGDDFLRQRLRSRLQPGGGCDFIHEAELQRRLRIDEIPCEQHMQGLLALHIAR